MRSSVVIMNDDLGMMWKDVKGCGRMWKDVDVEGCERMWKNVKECGMT
jgi:hypothetical protein